VRSGEVQPDIRDPINLSNHHQKKHHQHDHIFHTNQSTSKTSRRAHLGRIARMRAPSGSPHCNTRSSLIKIVSISPSSTLHINLTISSPQSLPVLLSSGIISLSPPYRLPVHTAFVPHRPNFSPPCSHAINTTEQTGRVGANRDAALIAHMNAELREDEGSWEYVRNECKKGRDGYNGPK
jgi:hypothetical protein